MNGFSRGDRVELHPATDAWMMGDRFGEILNLRAKFAIILMDRSNKTRRVPYGLFLAID